MRCAGNLPNRQDLLKTVWVLATDAGDQQVGDLPAYLGIGDFHGRERWIGECGGRHVVMPDDSDIPSWHSPQFSEGSQGSNGNTVGCAQKRRRWQAAGKKLLRGSVSACLTWLSRGFESIQQASIGHSQEPSGSSIIGEGQFLRG
jgi:hypothetical protein